MGAGLAAAVAGGNINIASQTGGNAAKNNALVCTVVAVALASLEVADKAITAYDAWRLAKAVHDGDTDTAAEVGAEIALGMATDAIPGDKVAILLGNTLSKVGLFALGTKIVGKYGKDTASRLIRIAEKLPASLDHTAEDLFKNAVTPNEHGISPISRAVDKHAFRAGSVYKPIAGSPDAKNRLSQELALQIMTNKNSVVIERSSKRLGDYVDIIAPDGKGLRFGKNGNFIGLLEP